MRPRLHRAAKIRLVLRLTAFVALLVACFAAGDLLAAAGISPVLAQLALLVAAFGALVLPALRPVLKPSRARATAPRPVVQRA